MQTETKEPIRSIMSKSDFIRKGFRRGDRLVIKIDKYGLFPEEKIDS